MSVGNPWKITRFYLDYLKRRMTGHAYLYIMIVALIGISATSIQHTHYYHPSGPQQGLQEGGILLWVVHLASQGGTRRRRRRRRRRRMRRTYVYSKNWSNHQKDNTTLSWILEKRMLKEIMVLFIISSLWKSIKSITKSKQISLF